MDEEKVHINEDESAVKTVVLKAGIVYSYFNKTCKPFKERR